jgi:hypothetical protein
MSDSPPANREDELRRFDLMMIGETDKRFLILQADGGMGKTTLLAEFMKRCPTHTSCAAIDLKGKSIGLHEVLYKLCDALKWEHFPTFAACVEGQGLGRVIIADNVIIGRSGIEVALRAPDEGDRAARRAELTRAFFTDLRTIRRRLLLIFDTFDDAPPDVQEWLQSSFLTFACNTPDLIVVIAGRVVPKESIEWGRFCIYHSLLPIPNPEPWQVYADHIGAVLHLDGIRVLCDLLEGHPFKMATALARYVPAGVAR